jgi:hypothetical protein
MKNSILMKFAVIAFLASLSACGGGAGTLAGQANKETQIYGPLSAEEKELLGPDQDGNGVRDDVDAWIARKFPDATHRTQLTNSAQWMTWSMLRGYRGGKTSRDELNAWTRSAHCRFLISYEIYGESKVTAADWRALIYNSKSRTLGFLKWDATLSGTVSTSGIDPCRNISPVSKP